MPEILSDEDAALIWSGQTIAPQQQSSGGDDAAKKAADAAKATADAEAAKKQALEAAKQAAANTNTGDDDDDDPELDDDGNPIKRDPITQSFSKTGTVDDDPNKSTDIDPKKQAGRKPSDLVTVVNQLIKDEELEPFEGQEEVKTIEEARELLKANLEDREKTGVENAWKEKVASYSPQIQAILHYAEQGAQSATQILELMGALKSVEDSYQFDDTTEIGQEQIIRQYYKSKGFKDSVIEKQVTLLKDAGKDSIKEAASEFLPDLQKASQDALNNQLRQQEANKQKAEEASRVYLTTVKTALEKDKTTGTKLTREDKAKIFEAVANPKYTSINGNQTTQFVKTLEEIQFGNKQDYEHFLDIVHLTVDPKGFMEKIKKNINNDIQEQTQKTLRQSKNNTQNSDQTYNSSQGGKKTVKRDFVNPFA